MIPFTNTDSFNLNDDLSTMFIHSGYFYSTFKSTTTQRCSWLQHLYFVGVNAKKHYRQLWVKDLPKVPTQRLEWDSNLRPHNRIRPWHDIERVKTYWNPVVEFLLVGFQVSEICGQQSLQLFHGWTGAGSHRRMLFRKLQFLEKCKTTFLHFVNQLIIV